MMFQEDFAARVPGQVTMAGGNANGIPTPYSDRFGLSLTADKTLFKEGALATGKHTVFTVADNEVVIVSNVWAYFTASSGSGRLELLHVFSGGLPGSNSDKYWGQDFDATNFWAIVQVHKVFEGGSSMVVEIDAAGDGLINVNIEGIRVETQ